jgi:hypothetical protein
MKKILTIAIATLVAGTSFAQKGSIFAYGNIRLSSTKFPNEAKTSSFEFTPSIGYQFDKSWSAGLAFHLMSNKQKNSVGTETGKNSMFAFGPFVRYTKNLSSMFSVYGQFDAMFGTEKAGLTEAKTTTMNLGVTPAIQAHVTKSLAINLSFGGLSYATSKADFTGAKTASGLDFNFGKNTAIGLQFNF